MSKDALNLRDENGEWRPPGQIVSAPISNWPPAPIKVFKWLFSWPGFIWPENIFWFGISLFTWIYLTPELVAMKTFEIWWIGGIYIRNLVFIILLFGGMHYFLYLRRSQGDRLRFTTKPFSKDNKRFKFGNQVRDNVFHTLMYGVPVFTAYEVLSYWLFANGYLGLFDLSSSIAFWIWFGVMLVLGPFIHAFHFYLGHRLLHSRLLYQHCHSLHHNNVQVGPWSGLSMHPVEHIICFSSVVIQWGLALHPLNALYQIHLAAFQPAPGHSGFEKMHLAPGFDLAAGSRFHYQHHKYFECNYGGSLVPLDKWFGTFHDGTVEADMHLHEQIRLRIKLNM